LRLGGWNERRQADAQAYDESNDAALRHWITFASACSRLVGPDGCPELRNGSRKAKGKHERAD
jgi:hypothetical protein